MATCSTVTYRERLPVAGPAGPATVSASIRVLRVDAEAGVYAPSSSEFFGEVASVVPVARSGRIGEIVSRHASQGPHSEARKRYNRRRVEAFGPALVAFVLTGLLAPLYSSEDFEPGLTAWQAFVLWPIGFLVLALPAFMLVGSLWDKPFFRAGQVALVAVAIWSMVTVARSEDAQAGLGFLIAPFFGGIAMAVLIGLQWLSRRRGRVRPSQDG